MIKRRVLALVSCFIILLAAACNPAGQRPDTDTGQIMFRDRTQGTYDAYDYVYKENPRGIRGVPNPVGYIRYQANNVPRANRVRNIYIDRNNLARQVGYLVTQQGIKDAAVLVTDDHVFVGINGNQELDFQTLRRIQQTALSITPRYYRVSIIQDKSLLHRINEVGTGRSRVDLQRLIRDLGDTTPPVAVQ